MLFFFIFFVFLTIQSFDHIFKGIFRVKSFEPSQNFVIFVETVDSRENQVSDSKRPIAEANIVNDGRNVSLILAGEEVQIGLGTIVFFVSEAESIFKISVDVTTDVGSSGHRLQKSFSESGSINFDFSFGSSLFSGSRSFGESERGFHLGFLAKFLNLSGLFHISF